MTLLTDRRPTMASPGNELIHRLLAGKCEICDAGKGLQVHHLRKLADLNRPGRPDRPPWMTLMAARRRKTLVVCSVCHHSIHAGRGSALPRK
jgi:AI2M/AI1M-like HNH endonuclease